ncbi:hypothetical protein BK659_08595 [Pseudomonas brassicacearum]|uniref:Type IV secretion protein Rhs n=1 Tax=Pseudomonas brassicacearum TaxID=930166 RepID=A0A423H9U2_9PSED|nr:hypothetical protein BK659_08595 [Pseudomonas brassicacearum]
MLNELRTFFDHSRHKLWVRNLQAHLDVLAFEGEERLSQPFTYRVEFTSTEHDLAAEQLLGQDACFSLHAPAKKATFLDPPTVKPLRTLHGVISGFKRLSGSNDEARYELTLQPRLALLGRGRQFRIYQHQSVPEIVESILRSRHDFEGQDFLFRLVREYPKREQVMQYGESDLAFIARLLAEVGIWYRFTSDERLRIDVVEFCDDQRGYQFDVQLPYRPPAGLSSGQDGVWQLQSSHVVVEKNIHFRAYHPLDAKAHLDGAVDQSRGAKTTYGEAYHYAEPYRVLGNALAQDEDLHSESGYFYARLRHERYLNGQTRLSGLSSSATLAPGQVLKISGGASQAFAPGAVIIALSTRAARDRSFDVSFEAMPYSETVCFRPEIPAKPQIAGTVPARVSSPLAHDRYAEIDAQGRYRVSFLFDRDSWKPGRESLWLRLARPYAGDTHGLHLPLIAGTEVAVAFEQGDPDRPYIAHALHDSQHPDPVTLYNYKRNVLRTPANNKLRMDDTRGQEHVKLSTEHSGKSQLNLGHLVDAKKQKRGEGFELRTDGWGAIRAGKGVFISADAQPKAQGDMFEMSAALAQLNNALQLVSALAQSASVSGALPADAQSQQGLREALIRLKDAGLIASAPAGIALTTPANIQLSAGKTLTATAGESVDVSVFKRFSVAAGESISLFAQKLGLKLFAARGPLDIQAQSDAMTLQADKALTLNSINGEIMLDAQQGITLVSRGAYIKLKDGSIEIGAPGELRIKNDNIAWGGAASLDKALAAMVLEDPIYKNPMQGGFQVRDKVSDEPKPYVRYRIEAAESGKVWKGTTDSQGFTERVYTTTPEKLSLIYDMEEEEEEEELDGITLRLGLFFDGTGNNQANAGATEQCRREDLVLFDQSELTSIIEQCNQYGFDGFDGNGFDRAPDSSYGNAPSNVVHLFRLYPDNTATPVTPAAQIGYVPVYLPGIGTSSGGKDVLHGLLTGRGETGVVARVEQAPAAIEATLIDFVTANPGTSIRRIEFDIFGFSRGAAAARHCANELLKPGRGLFGELLQAGRFGLQASFDPAVDVSLNLIGLFDTVAAIMGSDLSVANDDNPGVNLYLPPGCAQQVIQLQARDERRHNFALNSVLDGHREISLPGAHSDIGGGYLPRARERLWLTPPRRVTQEANRPVQAHLEWAKARTQMLALEASGLAGDEGHLSIHTWSMTPAPQGKNSEDKDDYLLTIALDRPVRGELSLIALRVMRELGVRHGVPFDVIDDQDRRFRLPEELQPIATQILDQVLGGVEVSLDRAQERLLRRRYIHQSAHWLPSTGVMAMKPTPDNTRKVYPNQPHKGYPE